MHTNSHTHNPSPSQPKLTKKKFNVKTFFLPRPVQCERKEKKITQCQNPSPSLFLSAAAAPTQKKREKKQKPNCSNHTPFPIHSHPRLSLSQSPFSSLQRTAKKIPRTISSAASPRLSPFSLPWPNHSAADLPPPCVCPLLLEPASSPPRALLPRPRVPLLERASPPRSPLPRVRRHTILDPTHTPPSRRRSSVAVVARALCRCPRSKPG